MKERWYLAVLTVILILSACSGKKQGEAEGKKNEETTEYGSVSEINEMEYRHTVSGTIEESTGRDFSAEGDTYVMGDFTGLETTANITAGNRGVNLSASGYVCDTEAGVFYAAENGIFREKENSMECVYNQGAEYLNYNQGKLYFITRNDRKMHVLTLETGEADTILEKVRAYYLCITDFGIYYVNHKNELYLLDSEGSTVLISDKAPGWMHFYGEWLIFAESANQSCLTAVNCLTGEKKQLLSYAMFPCISGQMLYYSGCKNGTDSFIGELNLSTGENRSLGSYWSGSKVISDDRLYFIGGSRICSIDLKNPVHAEELYSDRSADMLSVSQGKVLFLSGKKIMYLQQDGVYEYAFE